MAGPDQRVGGKTDDDGRDGTDGVVRPGGAGLSAALRRGLGHDCALDGVSVQQVDRPSVAKTGGEVCPVRDVQPSRAIAGNEIRAGLSVALL